MDKPQNLSMKDWIVRKMSTETMIQERVIDAVVNHQFDGIVEAMKKYNSVELSGFGKFFFNFAKAKKKLGAFIKKKEELEILIDDPSVSDIRRRNAHIKIEELSGVIGALKSRMDEDK